MADIDLSTVQTDNPEALAAVFAQIEAGAVEKVDPPAPTPDPKPEVTPEPAKVETVTQGQESEEGAIGIQAKDGKHIIPYSTLKGARERAAQAERMVQEQAEQLETLRAQLKNGNQGANTGEPARTTDIAAGLSEEDRAFLGEDYPTILKAIDAQAAQLAALQSQLKPVVERTQAVEVEKQRTDANEVQDAIDAVPVLAHIQSTDADAFELAKKFDAELKDLPAWKDKPLSERFAKVAEMVQLVNGPIKLPSAPSTPTGGNLTEAAKAKAAKDAQENKSAVPTSLSDFPAGGPPANDEKQALEGMSHFQLAEKFAAMTPEQQDAYLKTLE